MENYIIFLITIGATAIAVFLMFLIAIVCACTSRDMTPEEISIADNAYHPDSFA